MGERGVFAIDRGLFEHSFFRDEPFTEREAWAWMIGQAVWQPGKRRVGRTVFDLKRGQLVHAIRFLAVKWQWSESRVRRFLERLRNEAMIDALPSSEATLITICKYDEYQFLRRAGDAPTGEPAASSRRREEELEEVKILGGGDTRARETKFSISPEACAFADELAQIAGYDDLKTLPLQWMNAQPAVRVQMMFDTGWTVQVMRETARAAMRKKRDGPPSNIRYFEPIFARAHVPQLPLATVQMVDSKGEPSNVIAPSRFDRQRPTRNNQDAIVAGMADALRECPQSRLGAGQAGRNDGAPPDFDHPGKVRAIIGGSRGD